uniref:Uncharacterized protein n=1 Tax=Meloidogyne javanica TaxID=6303 RepID=A0A915N1K8_MELJA
MLYKIIGAATISVSSICVLAQLLLLPWLYRYTVNLRSDFESRLRKFHHNTRQFDEQFQRLRRLTGNSLTDFQHERSKRQLQECPPPRVGPPGLPGGFGEDGEAGTAGEDGTAGLDAITLLLQEAQKCPQGPVGPMGAPGQQGLPGLKGEKGETGEIGTDGIDGEQGPEGMPGLPGIAGKPGKRGQPGAPAPGGTGPPGPPGVKGRRLDRAPQDFPKNILKQGPPGEDGADARFCPCPSELNKLGSGGIRSHLSLNNPSPPPKISTSTTTITASFNKDSELPHNGVVEKEEVTKKEENSEYEDVAYPNYENDGTEGEGIKENKETLLLKNKKFQKIKFDNVEMNLEGIFTTTKQQQQTEENNEEEENDEEKETTTIATRRFVYVTKRPRPKL